MGTLLGMELNQGLHSDILEAALKVLLSVQMRMAFEE
jgi:hypothetical protein